VLGDKGYSSLGGIGGMVRLWQAAAFPSRGPMGGELQMDDIKSLVTRTYDAWNARDRDSWLACCNEDITFSGPGGIAGKGFDTGRTFWSLWQDPFPDNVATISVAATEGNEAIHEAVFTGTHTEIFHLPDGQDIPPTGKRVAFP